MATLLLDRNTTEPFSGVKSPRAPEMPIEWPSTLKYDPSPLQIAGPFSEETWRTFDQALRADQRGETGGICLPLRQALNRFVESEFPRFKPMMGGRTCQPFLKDDESVVLKIFRSLNPDSPVDVKAQLTDDNAQALAYLSCESESNHMRLRSQGRHLFGGNTRYADFADTFEHQYQLTNSAAAREVALQHDFVFPRVFGFIEHPFAGGTLMLHLMLQEFVPGKRGDNVPFQGHHSIREAGIFMDGNLTSTNFIEMATSVERGQKRFASIDLIDYSDGPAGESLKRRVDAEDLGTGRLSPAEFVNFTR